MRSLISKSFLAIILISSWSQIVHTTKKPVTLPDLPYGYKELEPVISEEIMAIHHTKHHKGYVKKFNDAMTEISEAITAQDTPKISKATKKLKFNGGGHINHSLFWTSLSPISKTEDRYKETQEIAKEIIATWGSFEKFQTQFNEVSISIEGSGWSWLVFVPSTKKIQIISTANQDTVYPLNFIPLYGLDVWEHAYYLEYKNDRASYVEEMWKIMNWSEIEKRFNDAKVATLAK